MSTKKNPPRDPGSKTEPGPPASNGLNSIRLPGKVLNHKIRIAYREFYDVPRMLIVTHRGLKLLLDCKFDEALDEYQAVYKVYSLPLEIDEHALQSWEALPERATKYLGDVPVDKVIFDASKRVEIDPDIINNLLDTSKPE